MKKICKNCKWWIKGENIPGNCKNPNWFISNPRELKYYISDNMERIEIIGYIIDIYPEFGCIHWKNNDS